MAGLNAKQARFAQEYLVDLNATQAAIRAGYSEKTAKSQGSRLLTNADVQAAIAAGREKLAERVQVSQEWVLKNLVAVAERCMQAEPVLDREGNPTGEYQFAHAGANKALELVGKHLKMFTDKSEVDLTVDARVRAEVELSFVKDVLKDVAGKTRGFANRDAGGGK